MYILTSFHRNVLQLLISSFYQVDRNQSEIYTDSIRILLNCLIQNGFNAHPSITKCNYTSNCSIVSYSLFRDQWENVAYVGESYFVYIDFYIDFKGTHHIWTQKDFFMTDLYGSAARLRYCIIN